LPYTYNNLEFNEIQQEIQNNTIPKNHASILCNYGEGTKDKYGHVRITGPEANNKLAISRADIAEYITDLNSSNLTYNGEYSIKFTKDCFNIPETLFEDLNLPKSTTEVFEGILINYNFFPFINEK
jgi:hypothetical protein